ncbi:hypothetical protein PsalBI1_03710 [Piscirickettsia salmonis]|nr:hypothetical protein PsalBI1_03710 [Piscirickettsia salmonis]
MLGDFASLDVQNTYRGSDAYAALFVRDGSGRHELVVGIDQLQFEYGWADSGKLLWTDMVIGRGQLALVKIKLTADSVSEEGEVAI